MKKMFLLGDSISGHYGPFLKDYLEDEYEIFSKPNEGIKAEEKNVGGNGGDSSMVLEYIKKLEAQERLEFDLFLLNCGLHDIKRKVPEEFHQVPIDLYEKNLREAFGILQNHGVPVIFVNTTPVDEIKHCTLIPAGIKRYNRDVLAYNEVAEKVAKALGIPVIDLHGFSGRLQEDKYCDYAHFNVESRKLQAAYLAGFIRNTK